MTTDTEARLRAALRAGAELITVEPAELPELPTGRRKYWVVWALAAAAVVIAVAALSVVARHSPSSAPRHPSSVPPAHHSSTIKSVAPPPTPRGLHPATCVASNAASWRRTLRAGLVPTSGPEHTPAPLAGVDDRGELILLESDEILLFGPGGHPRPIYTVPSSMRLDVGRFGGGLPEPVFDGDWVAFATEPERHGSPGLSHLGVVNIQSGDVRMIYDRTGSAMLHRPILVHGVVYWTVTDLSGSGLVYSYDIATGARHSLDAGLVTGPFTVGGGVYWVKNQSVVTHIPGVLPPGYVIQASANAVFGTDGARLAWVRGDDILVRQAGGPSVSVYHSTAGVQPQVVALVGPYLVWHDSAQYDLKLTVLDLRTGATARLTQVGPAVMPVGTPTGPYLALDIRDGLFTPPTVVDTARAPRLHC